VLKESIKTETEKVQQAKTMQESDAAEISFEKVPHTEEY
jgi:hypothetical protein